MPRGALPKEKCKRGHSKVWRSTGGDCVVCRYAVKKASGYEAKHGRIPDGEREALITRWCDLWLAAARAEGRESAAPEKITEVLGSLSDTQPVRQGFLSACTDVKEALIVALISDVDPVVTRKAMRAALIAAENLLYAAGAGLGDPRNDYLWAVPPSLQRELEDEVA